MATSNYIPIREIVYLYSEAARKSEADFLRLWRLAYRGWAQCGMNHFWLPKTVSLPVNDNKTVTFPPDYIQWIKIGYDDGTGITGLRNNQGLNSSTYAGAADFAKSDFWYSGDRRIGISKYVADISFKVEGTHFSLQPDFANATVLLEYLAAPEKDNDYQIPIQFQEALIDFISWQDIKHIPATSHFGRGDKQDRALAFRQSLKLAKRAYKPFRISEAYQ